MSRAAIAALALVGGTCLGTGTADASNMGFKLERRFDLQRRPDGSALPNVYWHSFPLFNGLPDAGFRDATNPDLGRCCVGDAGCPAGDNIYYEAVDALCDMYVARRDAGQQGAFQFSYINRDTCQIPALTAAVAGTRLIFTGTNFPMQADIGYQINIGSSSRTITPQNPTVTVGSHDPAFTGHMVQVGGPTCGATAVHTDLLNLPYHSMLQTVDEIICGTETVDWQPDPVSGNPLTCFEAGVGPTGIFDGSHSIQVQYFDNAGAARPISRTLGVAGTRLIFTGPDFDLVPGEAYKVILDRLHTPTRFLSPHY